MNREQIKQKLIQNKTILTYVGGAVGSFVVLTLCLTTVGVMVNSGNVSSQKQSELEQKVQALESQAEDLKKSVQSAERRASDAEQKNAEMSKKLREDLDKLSNLPGISCSDSAIKFDANKISGTWSFIVPKDRCISYRRELNLGGMNSTSIFAQERVFITDQVGVGANGIHISTPITGVPYNPKLKEKSKTTITTKDGFKIELVVKQHEELGYYQFEAFHQSVTGGFSLSTDAISKEDKTRIEKDITSILKSLDFNQG